MTPDAVGQAVTQPTRGALVVGAGWLGRSVAVALASAAFVGLVLTARPGIPPSAHGVWPPAWRAAVCDGYLRTEDHALSLPANVARVTAMLDAAEDYPAGREMTARLRDLLAVYRAADAAQARADRKAMTLWMGRGEPATYRFYDAMTALTAETGEHCL